MHRWMDRLSALLFRHIPVAHADTAPLYAVGSGLTPAAGIEPEIRMTREVVDIWIFPTLAVVEATFELENEGPATELEVGFPCFRAQSYLKARGVALADFQVQVDGQPVPHVERQLANPFYPLWRAWRQGFPAGHAAVVRVAYWVPLFSYKFFARMPFTYVLRTGRFWKGTIGEATVRVHTVDVPFDALQEATPSGYVMDSAAGTLTWQWSELVPEHDIGLLISPTMIQASLAGVHAWDILDLNETRPPIGTPVTVGGNLRRLNGQGGLEVRPGQTGKALLRGERYGDGGIVVPDGIAAVRSGTNEFLTGVLVLFTPQTRHETIRLPALEVGCLVPRGFVHGRVAEDEGRFCLIADAWVQIDEDHEHPHQSAQLPVRFPRVHMEGHRQQLMDEMWEASNGERDATTPLGTIRKTAWPGGSTRYQAEYGFDGVPGGERARVPHPRPGGRE